MMASALLLVMLLVCVPNVMSLTPDQIHRVTDYIKETIAGGASLRYSYVVKFTKDECQSLSNENITNALEGEDRAKIKATVQSYRGIYTGPRMVVASSNRLVYTKEDDTYLIDNLLYTGDEAGCVVFYSVFSPCIDFCLSPNGTVSVFNVLNVFRKIDKNNKALVFRYLFFFDSWKNETNITLSWRKVNDNTPMYRCKQGCTQCFQEPNILNKDCLQGPFLPCNESDDEFKLPFCDTKKPDSPQPSDRRKPDVHKPSTSDRRMPDSHQSSTGDRRMPDSHQPSTGDRRMGDSHQPSTGDRRMPDSHQPSTGDRRMPDSHQPSTGDKKMPDSHQPSTGNRSMSDSHQRSRKPNVHQRSSSDRRKPDVQQSSSSDRRKPDVHQPSSSDRSMSGSHQLSTGNRRMSDSHQHSNIERRMSDINQPSTSNRKMLDIHQPSTGNRK